MTPNSTQSNESNQNQGIPIFQLWDKYESIAMHFNDLILKVRIQALASVAAISVIVGVFNKDGAETQTLRWIISASIFFLLILFWVAIWIIDFAYYNRLLYGSVNAIKALETSSANGVTHITKIELSSKVEEQAKKNVKENFWGRWLFYSLVFLGLLLGLVASIIGVCVTKTPSIPIP